jgi:hypothetical protein
LSLCLINKKYLGKEVSKDLGLDLGKEVSKDLGKEASYKE